MPEQYRRTFEDDYRRGRRSWSDRARDEARPWLRDEEFRRQDARWRRDEGQQNEGRDDRPANAVDRSWRDQADGSYERSPRVPTRWGRDFDHRGPGRFDDWPESDQRVDSGAAADERYRQWRGAFNPEFFESDDSRASERAGRGADATSAGYRDGGGRESDAPRGNGFAGRGPKGYHRSDDRIKEDVCERLMDDRDVDASEITVEVVNGEVTLSGTVDDRWQKRRAEDIADAVTGVTEVANNIRLSRQERGQDSHVMSGRGTSGLRSSSSPASGSSEATNPTTSAV
jgi:osmotically-inducible protein OsmY